MSERISRRSFLSLNWEASIGFLGNVILPQIEEDRGFFRPPGSGSELEHLTSCTRCGDCQHACPEGIINLFSIQNGAKLAGTPYIDPNEAPCTFCGKCIESCTTGALNMNNLKEQKAVGTAVVKKSNCLAFKDVICDYCARSCPEQGALLIVNGVPVVNEKLCTGCGSCVSSCISEGKGIYVDVLRG